MEDSERLQNTYYFFKRYFGGYYVRDVISEYRIVKRYYKCNQETGFKRTIITVYPLNKQWKSRQIPFQIYNGNTLITYCFSGEERNINPC